VATKVSKVHFFMGQLLFTRGVNELGAENPDFLKFVMHSVSMHAQGDWGDVDTEDKEANNQALKEGTRLFSAYNDDRFPKNGVATIWIITEADRSATTVLFPDEY